MLLDTTFLIDLMVGDSKAIAKAQKLEVEGIPRAIGAPTVFELWSGIAQSDKPEDEKKRIQEIVVSITQLPLDTRSAIMGGTIYGELATKGETIDPEDAMLGGIAKANNETILTRNVKHFGKIEDLVLETY
jgi:tRNA(fMet)-specific endonuclease VapC